MNSSNTILPGQLPLEFNMQPEMGRDDFMVSDCNREAFLLIDSWPNWIYNGMFLYGPKGCGKTHLANLLACKIRSSTTPPMKVSIYDANQINMRNVNRICEDNFAVVIENLTAKANNEALFHLFNLLTGKNAFMLWTSKYPSNRIDFRLKDLQSRINMLPSVEIKEPDDIMLQMLIVKLFNDKQLSISPEILRYIVTNTRRSFAYVADLVEEIDKISLAYQASVSYKIVSKALDIINLKHDGEPDLFSKIL